MNEYVILASIYILIGAICASLWIRRSVRKNGDAVRAGVYGMQVFFLWPIIAVGVAMMVPFFCISLWYKQFFEGED